LKNIFLASTFIILLTSCVTISHTGAKKENHKNSNIENSNMRTLSNEGTICLSTNGSRDIDILYYPLSSSCISSSSISWKLLGVDSKLNGSRLNIETYALYKRNSSPIATADCGGAGVRKKSITLNSLPTTIYWGSEKIIDTPQTKGIYCFKKSGKDIKRVRAL